MRFCRRRSHSPDQLNHFGHGGKISTKKRRMWRPRVRLPFERGLRRRVANQDGEREREEILTNFRARSIGQRIWCIRRRRNERSRGQCHAKEAADLSEVVRKSAATVQTILNFKLRLSRWYKSVKMAKVNLSKQSEFGHDVRIILYRV